LTLYEAAERLYTSAQKILASLKTREEKAARGTHGSSHQLGLDSTSRLLKPTTEHPFLDYLETVLTGRAKFLSQGVATYRAFFESKVNQSTSTTWRETDEREGLTSKLLRAKYLRTPSTGNGMKDKKRAAVSMAIERLEKSMNMGKSEAALLLADLHLVSTQFLISCRSLYFIC
jgi:hypothetical protein